MNLSRAHTLAAGLGLIALTNAVALVGVAYNRRGDPEATLRLTQRELRAPYRWGSNHENSGLALSLIWRVPQEQAAGNLPGSNYPGREPVWLDAAKMLELGFQPPPSGGSLDVRGTERYEKQLSREVLLVLELDGPAYRRSLELTARYLAGEEAKLAASPGDRALTVRVNNARDALERETSRNSRLFVTDAGLDVAALRAKYPDRARYAIVRGQVTPWHNGRDRYSGYVRGPSVDSINVPFALREVFAGTAGFDTIEQRNLAPFDVVVAFGKRLEPWIVDGVKR